MSLKMGDFNTPSVFRFFKRKRRLEIYYFKTAAWLLVFCSGAQIPAAETTVFLYAVVLAEVLNYQDAFADTIETLPLTVPKAPSGVWRYSL